jgi:hypothetical protein
MLDRIGIGIFRTQAVPLMNLREFYATNNPQPVILSERGKP